jgi:superfamily II DNA or RNA helicase
MRNKDEIQQEIIDKIVKNQLKGIVLSSVRSGKSRILLKSIQYLEHISPKVLVLYPNIDILQSWKNEMDLINYYPNITFSTFISTNKVKDEKWDIIIADEGHLIPEENILPKFAEICKKCERVIIASGTYSSKTLETLKEYTGLDLIVEYSTEQAIKDGIICDFTIYIHQYNLDAITKKVFGKTKKWISTELKECNRLSNKVNITSGQGS